MKIKGRLTRPRKFDIVGVEFTKNIKNKSFKVFGQHKTKEKLRGSVDYVIKWLGKI